MGKQERRILQKYIFVRAVVMLVVIIHLFAFPERIYSAARGETRGPEAATTGATGAWPPEVDGWKLVDGPAVYGPEKTYAYMDGAAELFIAYNMKRLTVLRYEKPGRPAITLEIYRMASPEDAYGLFSFESGEAEAGIGQGSGFGGGLLRFWKGYYFVSTYGDGTGADVEAASLDLGRGVADAMKETGSPPKILDLLPAGDAPFARIRTWYLHSHVLLNQCFFVSNKNILNLTGDVEAALARYRAGTQRVHLLLVKYPDVSQAERGLSSFRAAYMAYAGDAPAVKKENGRWTVAAKRGAYVVIVFDAPDRKAALKWIAAASAPLS